MVTTHERESATQEMDSFLTPEVAPEVTKVLNCDIPAHIDEYTWRSSGSNRGVRFRDLGGKVWELSLQLPCIVWDAQRICRLLLFFRHLLRPEMMVIHI